VGLRAYCDGRVSWSVHMLESIVTELEERLGDLREAARAVDTRSVAGHAVWSAYHQTYCRYRRLQADVIRQLLNEVDPSKRWAREEAVVDIDDLLEPVCPRCREPLEKVPAS
jgi:hypothetical protein